MTSMLDKVAKAMYEHARYWWHAYDPARFPVLRPPLLVIDDVCNDVSRY